MKLAKEFVENAVIEEDIGALLKYLRRYFNLADVVDFGISYIEKFLVEDGAFGFLLDEHARHHFYLVSAPLASTCAESNLSKFVDDGDLTTFILMLECHKSSVDLMYKLFSVIYILAKHRKWVAVRDAHK